MSLLVAVWLAFIRFLGNLFSKSSSNTPLPVPVTARVSVRASSPLDRSTPLSDGSLEVISLRDCPPLDLADIGPLPSPWSPTGKKTPQDVWMSVDGTLVNATGPLDDPDGTAMLLSTISLYSSSSALGAFGISVFDNLDQDTHTTQVRDENHPALVTQTPPKGLDTTHSSRATKHFSAPLTKRDNAGITTASPISSLAYELRMGLFADGRSMSAFDNIIPLLDQASPESHPNDPVEVI